VFVSLGVSRQEKGQKHDEILIFKMKGLTLSLSMHYCKFWLQWSNRINKGSNRDGE
jgi:hypothetical protein